MLAALAVAVAAVAGCSTAPSGGGATQVSAPSNQVQAYTLPLPPPRPTASWKASQVVLGFLHASATFDLDPTAARQYLTAQARKHWAPASVTVVRAPTPTQFQVEKSPNIPQPAEQFEEVSFTGDRLAALSPSGQYHPSSGSASYQFQMVKGPNGIWLIDSIAPSNVLLLTLSDFQLVYQPRNLFFFAPPIPGGSDSVLVPDPVFAPIQVSDTTLNTGLATGLVKGLIQDSSSWLSGGTNTAFPPGTTLIGDQVTISGPANASKAVVDLGGTAAHASAYQRIEMAEQLDAMLGDTSYSATPVATSVELQINHQPLQIGPQPNLVPQVTPAPGTAAPQGWYAETPKSVSPVTQFGSAGKRAGVAELAAGQIADPQAITTVAVSPGIRPELAVAVQDGRGCTLDVGPLQSVTPSKVRYHSYPLTGSAGPCTSLSWTNNGAKSELWAVAGGRIWVLPGSAQAIPVNGHALQVSAPVPAQADAHASQLLALRMAPDGVRAALLVHTQSGNHLMLAAVSNDGMSFGPAVAVGTGLANPVALSWFDAYHLAVLTHGEVYEVPLTGSEGTQLGSVPPNAQTITSDSKLLVIGTSDGQLWTSAPGQLSWRAGSKGINPVFAG